MTFAYVRGAFTQERTTDMGTNEDQLKREVTELTAQTERLQQQLENFREQVRKEAIRVARQQDWCDNGLNETMDNLGLPHVTDEDRLMPGKAEIVLRLYRTATIDVVGAADDDDVYERAGGLSESEVLAAANVTVPDGWTFEEYTVDTGWIVP
jgi:hypothetical protein